MHSQMWKNIVVTGGNTNFETFKERLERDTMSWSTSTLKVHQMESPDAAAYRGLRYLATDKNFG